MTGEKACAKNRNTHVILRKSSYETEDASYFSSTTEMVFKIDAHFFRVHREIKR
jgi:hypothetical protein